MTPLGTRRASVAVCATDDVSFTAELWIAEGRAPIPAVLILPAMGVPGAFYARFADALSSRVHVAVGELRGVGTSSVRASRDRQFGYLDLVEQDIAAFVATVRSALPEGTPLYLLGHSLGGQLGLLFGAIQPGVLRGMILVASASVYFRAYPLPTGLVLLALTHSAVAIASLLGYFPGHRLGFGGRASGKQVRDWARYSRTGIFRFSEEPIDLEAALRSVRLPVLAIDIAGDFLAPPSAVAHGCAKLEAASITRWTYVAATPVNHFSWAKNALPLAERVHEWLATEP